MPTRAAMIRGSKPVVSRGTVVVPSVNSTRNGPVSLATNASALERTCATTSRVGPAACGCTGRSSSSTSSTPLTGGGSISQPAGSTRPGSSHDQAVSPVAESARTPGMRSTRVVVVSDSTSRLGARWSHARSASSVAMAVQRDHTARGSERRRAGPAAAMTSSATALPPVAALAATRRLMAADRACASPEATSSPTSGVVRSSAGPYRTS